MELKATDHRYYCSDSNYYVNGIENFGRNEFESFKDFKDEWALNDGTIDCDYNLCFRYDIKRKTDPETDELAEGYELWLYFILQRKGIYRPVWIKNLVQEDMKDLELILKEQWEYIKRQWCELN